MKTILKIGLFVLMILIITAFTGAKYSILEEEPNDSIAEANSFYIDATVNGAIDPVSDLDYFSWNGISVTTWGFIALLDTSDSTFSKDAVLTAYQPDTTFLTADAGSWENGSGIALQPFVGGASRTYYLEVREEGMNAEIDSYHLDVFHTVVDSKAEAEPNDTVSTGTISSMTNAGVINDAGDKDCFRFTRHADDEVVIALDSDPEGNGGPNNYQLQLYNDSGSLLKTADHSTGSDPEFIVLEPLIEDAIYAFCVSEVTPTNYGADHTYLVGLAAKTGLYRPDYSIINNWVDPRPGDAAKIGDTMTFELGVTNDDLLPIPGAINISASFDSTCMEFVSADPPTSSPPGEGSLSWAELKTDLLPNETYQITVIFRAANSCSGRLNGNIRLDHFLTGAAAYVNYTILWDTYLPLLTK